MTTLSTHVNTYLKGRYTRGEISRNTVADFRYTLSQLDASYGDRPLDRFGPAAIDRWLESIGHHAPATRREYLSRVRGFAQWLAAQGLICGDPTAHVPAVRQPRTQPRTLTRPQVARLLTVLPDRRARAIVWLMVGCGCRCVEVARLRVEDYDPAARTILLVGKAMHERVLPVPREVARVLDSYLDEVGVVAGPLIRSHHLPSQGLSARTISAYVRGWLREANVKTRALDGRSAHGLRRTAASDMVEEGADIRIVQHMLGHARLETTARAYLRPVELAAMRDAMEGRRYDSAA